MNLITTTRRSCSKGELDCYFVSRTEVNDVEGAEFAVAHPSQLVVIVPRNNDLWSRESLTLSQLKEENFIMWDLRTVPSLTAAYIQACRNAGFEPNVIGYGTKMADVTTMALMYGAVALTDATAGYIENDQQRIIPLRNAPAGFDIAVVKLRENKNKLACRFVEYFRTLYGPHEQKE